MRRSSVITPTVPHIFLLSLLCSLYVCILYCTRLLCCQANRTCTREQARLLLQCDCLQILRSVSDERPADHGRRSPPPHVSGAWPVSMAAEVVQQTELFTDIFEITDKDPDGKKFDKGVSCAWWLLL